MKYVYAFLILREGTKDREQTTSVYEEMTDDHGLSANLDDLHKKAKATQGRVRPLESFMEVSQIVW